AIRRAPELPRGGPHLGRDRPGTGALDGIGNGEVSAESGSAGHRPLLPGQSPVLPGFPGVRTGALAELGPWQVALGRVRPPGGNRGGIASFREGIQLKTPPRMWGRFTWSSVVVVVSRRAHRT